jgi:hypothetical protein
MCKRKQVFVMAPAIRGSGTTLKNSAEEVATWPGTPGNVWCSLVRAMPILVQFETFPCRALHIFSLAKLSTVGLAFAARSELLHMTHHLLESGGRLSQDSRDDMLASLLLLYVYPRARPPIGIGSARWVAEHFIRHERCICS